MKTKMNIKFKMLGFALSLLLSSGLGTIQANAQATGSHGGDPYCEEFYDLAFEISTDMTQIGQLAFGNQDLIDVGQVRQIVMKPLPVTPRANMSRPAVSNTILLSTQLDTTAWRAMDTEERIGLVIHELMVLSGKEVDGVYNVSQIVTKVLTNNGFFAHLKYSPLCRDNTLDGCIFNDDGSVTLNDPYMFSKHRDVVRFTYDDSSADGLCKFLDVGFTRGFNVNPHTEKTRDALKFDEEGRVKGSTGAGIDLYIPIVSRITCR